MKPYSHRLFTALVLPATLLAVAIACDNGSKKEGKPAVAPVKPIEKTNEAQSKALVGVWKADVLKSEDDNKNALKAGQALEAKGHTPLIQFTFTKDKMQVIHGDEFSTYSNTEVNYSLDKEVIYLQDSAGNKGSSIKITDLTESTMILEVQGSLSETANNRSRAQKEGTGVSASTKTSTYSFRKIQDKDAEKVKPSIAAMNFEMNAKNSQEFNIKRASSSSIYMKCAMIRDADSKKNLLSIAYSDTGSNTEIAHSIYLLNLDSGLNLTQEKETRSLKIEGKADLSSAIGFIKKADKTMNMSISEGGSCELKMDRQGKKLNFQISCDKLKLVGGGDTSTTAADLELKKAEGTCALQLGRNI